LRNAVAVADDENLLTGLIGADAIRQRDDICGRDSDRRKA
jgi:hypothetical protein